MTCHGCSAKIVERTIEEPPIKVSYPEVQGLKSVNAENKINSAIYSLVQRMIQQQAQPWVNDPDFRLAEMVGNYKITVNRNCVLSIRFENYAYFAMAAHGLTVVKSITANLRRGEIYSLKDLFSPSSQYRVKINRWIEKQIREQQIPILKEFGGITGYQDFYLTDSELVIYYQLYELTPYAYGIPEFRIPYSYLSDMLSLNSPIRVLMDRSMK